MRRAIKDHQTVVDQQPDPETNVTKASENFLIPGDYDMVQHVRILKKSVPQEIVAPWR